MQKVVVFEAEKDLSFDKNLKAIRRELNVETGDLVFDPESLKDVAKDFRVEAYRLSEEELHAWGVRASKLRQQFTEKAAVAMKELATE